MNTQHVIIGAGVAGLAAAEAIRSRDANSPITIIHDDPHGFYSRPGLAYYLSGEIPRRQLFPFDGNRLADLKVRTIRARATRLDLPGRNVQLDANQWVSFDRLLLATGSQAVRPNLPGVGLQGVVTLDNLENADQIRKLARRARSAVVVGGGITALELVEGLASCRMRVHYFLRGDHYWRSVLDETESDLVLERLAAEGVQVHRRTEVVEILEKRGKVAGVRTRDGKTLGCQIVALAVGVRPRLELVRAAGLQYDRGLAVNDYLQVPGTVGVYAAGDIAQVYDPLTGESGLDVLWNTARSQGWAAGLNMSGSSMRYRKTPPFNVTRLAGLTTTIIGQVGGGEDIDVVALSRGESETWRHFPNALVAEDRQGLHRVRILLGPDQIMGALIIGEQALSFPLQQLVLNRASIGPIRERLLAPGAPLQDLIIQYWKHLIRKGDL
jgi:NAD(P)H-nitrite reductase large subunit